MSFTFRGPEDYPSTDHPSTIPTNDDIESIKEDPNYNVSKNYQERNPLKRLKNTQDLKRSKKR